MNICWKCTPFESEWVCFFIGKDLEKCLHHITCSIMDALSEWVPPQWEFKQLIRTQLTSKFTDILFRTLLDCFCVSKQCLICVYFSPDSDERKQYSGLLNCLNFAFVYYKHVYLCTIVMFLLAVWTLILTAPIHCRGSIDDIILNLSKYVQRNKQTTSTSGVSFQ